MVLRYLCGCRRFKSHVQQLRVEFIQRMQPVQGWRWCVDRCQSHVGSADNNGFLAQGSGRTACLQRVEQGV